MRADLDGSNKFCPEACGCFAVCWFVVVVVCWFFVTGVCYRILAGGILLQTSQVW